MLKKGREPQKDFKGAEGNVKMKEKKGQIVSFSVFDLIFALSLTTCTTKINTNAKGYEHEKDTLFPKYFFIKRNK